MQRLWLRWLVLALFLAVVVVAFVNLGRWQLSRLDERRVANQNVTRQEQEPVRPAVEALASEVTDAQQWRRVELAGTFDGDQQLTVRVRRNGEDRGIEVLTPLQPATGGPAVLVSRGFVQLPRGQQLPEALPAPPEGTVEVSGWLRRNETGRDPLIRPTRSSVRLVNAPAVAATLPYPVQTTGWVAAYEVEPAQPGDLEPIQTPVLTEGNHFSYALQWFAFTAIAGVGGFVLVRGDLRERRSRQQQAVGPPEQVTGSREPAAGPPERAD